MKKYNLSNLIFFISYFLFLFSRLGTNISFISTFSNLLAKISLIILVLNFFVQEKMYKKKDLIIIFFISLFSLIIYFITRDINLLSVILFLLCSKNKKLDELLKIDFKSRIFISLIIIVLNAFNLTLPVETYRDSVFRNSLGFIHPNTLGINIFVLCCEYAYLYVKKLKIHNIILLLSAIVFLEITAKSRTSEICIIILIFVLLFLKKEQNIEMFKKILKILPIILIAISFLGIYIYSLNNEFSKSLNKILSNRLIYAYSFFEEYNINFFGNRINSYDELIALKYNLNSWVLDNSYLIMLLKDGLFMYILILYIYYKSILKLDNSKLAIIILIYLILGLSETYLIKIAYNPFLFYFSKSFYCEKEKKTNE